MDRMTPLDAAFLETEDEEPGVSLAISSIAVFAGPPPSLAEFSAMVEWRLPLIPRYRHKVRQIPFDLGPPVWVDDEHFDLRYHLRHTALPSPGGDDELAALMARVMSARLDRERPLWEYWLVEGLADDRWALISKIHHCMVDGVSGTDLYGVILDDTAEPRPAGPDEWQPDNEPSTVALLAGALRELALNPFAQAGAVAAALREPRKLTGRVWDTARGLVALSSALQPARPSSLSGPLSAHRRFAFARASVEDVKAVRHSLGGTFNDVLLAAISGGLRTLLLARGEEPLAHCVRAMVPVSVRAPSDLHIRDNRVSLMLTTLPVDIADPVARLAAVRTRLDAVKSDKEAESVAALTELARQEPFPLIAPVYRLVARLPQRTITTVTTNVPGPRKQLYALGRPLLAIIPYVPIASSVRTGISILSYLDGVTFGVTGDYDSATDIAVLAHGIEDALAELVKCAAGEQAHA